MPLLHVEHLKKYYPVPSPLFAPRRCVKAVDDVSFELNVGETLGLVGESGCGKSTMARLLMRLEPPTDGSILLNGMRSLRGQRREAAPDAGEFPDDLSGPLRFAEPAHERLFHD